MGLVRGTGNTHGSDQRTLRQVHHDVLEPDVRTELVQFLSDAHHDRYLRVVMVSEAPPKHSIPVEMDNYAHFHIHLHR